MLKIMKASAGSGKTYNLAKKYITLLLQNDDRYAYRHILAVTFTNKATEEMKSRIMEELYILATEPAKSDYHDSFIPSLFASDEDLRMKAENVLRDILHDYSAFAVSTIDKFFQQTLKAFSREIGQFASYQVELDKNSLVAESVDRILDSLTEDSGALLSWLTTNVMEQIEAGGRYSMDANLLEMANRLMSPQRQEVMAKNGVDEEVMCSKEQLMSIKDKCRELTEVFRAKVVDHAKAVADILTQSGVNAEETNGGFMKQIYAYSELEPDKKIEAPTAAFMKKAASPQSWFAKTKEKEMLHKLYPHMEDPLNAFVALFGKEFAVYNTALILDSQLYGLGVADEISRTFKEMMKEKNVLCIDDSNTILRDIIDGSDAPFVYEKIGVRFDHFLLDEFQDTAHVQWMNFCPLLENSEAQDGQNLIVGDVKQSIYRWRGSDWKLLDSTVPETFKDHKQKVLDTNYRSLSSIVNFNNGFFMEAADIIDKLEGEPDLKRMKNIYADVRQEIAKKDKPEGNVCLTFCEAEDELQKVLDSVMEARSHGAKLSDIAVLVRSNAVGERVASYLIEKGVSVITDDSLKVKNSMMVRRIVSLMSCVENPMDTVGSFLAESLNIEMPEGHMSLTDMAESLFRGLVVADEDALWSKESLHIQTFMDHLQDYVSSNGNALRGFLKWWEGENPSISSPSTGDSVRVMTIHKSKGLDFPYVIIPYVENITLFKKGKSWCAPDLKGTELEGLAEGVYDVTLSSSSASSLFAEDYHKERFLQYVDNMNTLYVAMTRPALGMHLIASRPSATCLKALGKKDLTKFSDLSQILYWYASELGKEDKMTCSMTPEEDRFEMGAFVDFNAMRKSDKTEVMTFEVAEGCEYPSIALNPSGEGTGSVGERGRLKFSEDAVDFFSDSGEAGYSASKRIRGVVLHDILSKVMVLSDLEAAVADAVRDGILTAEESDEALAQLSAGISGVQDRGWFPESGSEILNETELIDIDGTLHRPDRVVITDGKVQIIDFKFGGHDRKYERQVKKYADIWRRMGYADVSAYLWYVKTGEVMVIL